MQEHNSSSKARKGLVGLAVLAAYMIVVVVALCVMYAFNAQAGLHSFAAQDDARALEEASNNEPRVTNASTQVIQLVSLMGMTQDEALRAIGHGADVQEQRSLSSLVFSNEVVVALTDEKGDALSGTPTVTLGFDGDGRVAAASYEAATSLLGYGSLAFAPAVTEFHIVEHMLGEVGLSGVEEGSVALPDLSEYSTYESDGKTLAQQMYSFKGSAQSGDQVFSWQVTLDYDYSQANRTSDLANTVKKVAVAIMKA